MRKREVRAVAAPRNDRLAARKAELEAQLETMAQQANAKLRQLAAGIEHMTAQHAQVQREGLRMEAELKGRIAEIDLLLGDTVPCQECPEPAKAEPAKPDA